MAANECPKCGGPIEILAANKRGLRNWKCKDVTCKRGGYYDHEKKQQQPNPNDEKEKQSRQTQKRVPMPKVPSKKNSRAPRGSGDNQPADDANKGRKPGDKPAASTGGGFFGLKLW